MNIERLGTAISEKFRRVPLDGPLLPPLNFCIFTKYRELLDVLYSPRFYVVVNYVTRSICLLNEILTASGIVVYGHSLGYAYRWYSLLKVLWCGATIGAC